MRSNRRIASSSASRRFLTLSACATSERSRSRSCSERCSTMTARAMSPTSSARLMPVTSDFQSPRATARTASVICTSGRLMRCDTTSMMPANINTEATAATISQKASERPSDFADAHQFVAQRMEFADRRERADPPLLEQRRRSATSSGRRWCAAATIVGRPRSPPPASRMPATEIDRSAVEHQQARTLKPGELLQHGLARRAASGARQAPRTHRRNRRRSARPPRRSSGALPVRQAPARSILVQREGAAHDARALAIVVGEDRPRYPARAGSSCSARFAATMSTLSL